MADAMNARHDTPSVRDSLQEYGRGLAGGLLFSLPLLYTAMFAANRKAPQNAMTSSRAKRVVPLPRPPKRF